MAGRDADGQLSFGAPVQLRRTPGAGAATAGQAAVLGGQQPVGDEPVEVEGGNGSGRPHRSGGLVLAHRAIPSDDEPVQGSTLRFCQRRHPGDALVEVVTGHRRLDPLYIGSDLTIQYLRCNVSNSCL